MSNQNSQDFANAFGYNKIEKISKTFVFPSIFNIFSNFLLEYSFRQAYKPVEIFEILRRRTTITEIGARENTLSISEISSQVQSSCGRAGRMRKMEIAMHIRAKMILP